jgi:phosphoribosyl-dephospho-CoA transferase
MRPERSALAGLRRHQLATLSAQGWREALAFVGTRAVAEPLRAWAQRGLPLVVPRQPDERGDGNIVLAWAAPTAAGRQRIAMEVPLRSVAYFHEFPLARDAAALLPRTARPAARTLLERLHGLTIQPRVYGSYGWQLLSGESYVRDGSDFDVWMAVENHTQASAAALALAGADTLGGVRLDGELLFPDGAGVAWREYAAWREGRARSMLVKRIDSVQLTHTLELPAWCEAEAA